MMTSCQNWRRRRDFVFYYVTVLAVLSEPGYRSNALEDSGANSIESTASSGLASGLRHRRHANSEHNNPQQERRGAIRMSHAANPDSIRSRLSNASSADHRVHSAVHTLGSGQTGGLTPLYMPFADWNPPPLVPGWWRNIDKSVSTPQHKAPQRPMHELCAASPVKVYMPDVFGHMNNVLLEYAHLLHYCVSAFDPLAPATMLLPRAYRRFVGFQTFDVRAATESWACVDLEVPSPPLPQLKASADATTDSRTAAVSGKRIHRESADTGDDVGSSTGNIASNSGGGAAAIARESKLTADSRANVVRVRAAVRASRAARAEKEAASQSNKTGGARLAARRLEVIDAVRALRPRPATATAAVAARVTGRPPRPGVPPFLPPTMRLERRNATDVYFDRLPRSGSIHGDSSGRSVRYEGSVLAQLVLRPSPALRQLVEEFERSLFAPVVNDTAAAQGASTASSRSKSPTSSSPSSQLTAVPQSYVVIHLRAFGPSCHVRVKRALERQRQTITAAQLSGREVETKDLCGMSTEYVDAAIAAHARSIENSAGSDSTSSPGKTSSSRGREVLKSRISDVRTWPVVLAHDGEDEARAAAIVSRYGARIYRGPLAPFVDLLLMVRAGLFIGNPASSFSTNAARVRYAVAAAKTRAGTGETAGIPGNSAHFYPATNLRCGGAPGSDPAQC